MYSHAWTTPQTIKRRDKRRLNGEGNIAKILLTEKK